MYLGSHTHVILREAKNLAWRFLWRCGAALCTFVQIPILAGFGVDKP
jgi:hypothetical protein